MWKEVQSCNCMACKNFVGPSWFTDWMYMWSVTIFTKIHTQNVIVLILEELLSLGSSSFTQFVQITSQHTSNNVCGHLWNPATNCGRSVISIFLAIVVPIRPPAATHAAICVITSTLGAMWPSVATMPPLTPIYNKTHNVLYHRNYDLTFYSLVVTISTITFNTKNQCTHWSKFSSISNLRKVYLLTMPRLFPSLEVVWALRPASAPMQHSDDNR